MGVAIVRLVNAIEFKDDAQRQVRWKPGIGTKYGYKLQ